MILRLDYDGLFCDQSTSIQAAYPGIPYDTYSSDLYKKFESDKIPAYKNKMEWYINTCGEIHGSVNKLKELINSGLFRSVHILTAKTEEYIPLMLLHMEKLGILKGPFPEVVMNNMANMSRSRGKVIPLYGNHFRNNMVTTPAVEFINSGVMGNMFNIPIDSIICVPYIDAKINYMKERPGVLLDDRIFTILDIIRSKEMPLSTGIWIEHVWKRDASIWNKAGGMCSYPSLADVNVFNMYSSIQNNFKKLNGFIMP